MGLLPTLRRMMMPDRPRERYGILLILVANRRLTFFYFGDTVSATNLNLFVQLDEMRSASSEDEEEGGHRDADMMDHDDEGERREGAMDEDDDGDDEEEEMEDEHYEDGYEEEVRHECTLANDGELHWLGSCSFF